MGMVSVLFSCKNYIEFRLWDFHFLAFVIVLAGAPTYNLNLAQISRKVGRAWSGMHVQTHSGISISLAGAPKIFVIALRYKKQSSIYNRICIGNVFF